MLMMRRFAPDKEATMKKQRAPFLLVIGIFTFLAAGCAGKETVLVKEQLAGNSAGAVAASQVQPEAAAKSAPVEETSHAKPSEQPPPGRNETVEPVPAAELAAALETIYFDYDRYTLSPEARESLLKSASLLAKKEAKLQIAGHCDERGSDDYNLALSEKRAVAARDYLVALGVPRERLSVIGYGKEKPAVPGHDEAAWAQNRRDEFLIQAE